MSHSSPVRHAAIVIFGATGDLTQRKLLPAMNDLLEHGLLDATSRIIGMGRTAMSPEQFTQQCINALPAGPTIQTLTTMLDYVPGPYDNIETYHELSRRLNSIDGLGTVLFYLATPPSLFATIAEQLGKAHLACESKMDSPCPRRIVLEKPFGRDITTAEQLDAQLKTAFSEHQIYRIDHYLGKETVQNLMVLRFANSLFEPVWNQEFIDHVQMTVAEKIGIGTRGEYYDSSGACRDMLQNHMMNLLALTTMERPKSLEPDAIRDAKRTVLEHLVPIDPNCMAGDVVRGQYTAGTIDGATVNGYHDEPHIPVESRTETFIALKAHIDNPRWVGVPFYLRTGKTPGRCRNRNRGPLQTPHWRSFRSRHSRGQYPHAPHPAA